MASGREPAQPKNSRNNTVKDFGDKALAKAKNINEDRMMALALLLPSVIGDDADDIVIEVMNKIIKSGRAPQVMASLAAQTGHLLRLEWGKTMPSRSWRTGVTRSQRQIAQSSSLSSSWTACSHDGDSWTPREAYANP